ncbi:hypothetical protein BC833DRAFT_233483 [Globomyces pollinis-pini]|nr:hypothetical protein BC833DRAFT_233483 [Globomyces pollinis-pini]KAJ2994569.1 hypothetical protein HDV02_001498 [Globomyces sp. JEL0801]
MNLLAIISGLLLTVNANIYGSAPEARNQAFINKSVNSFKFAALNTTEGRIIRAGRGSTRESCWSVRLNPGEAFTYATELSANTGVFFFFSDDCSPNTRLGGTPALFEIRQPVNSLVTRYKDRVESFQLVTI